MWMSRYAGAGLTAYLLCTPFAHAQFISCVSQCINQSTDNSCDITDIKCICRESNGKFLPDLVLCMHATCDPSLDVSTLLTPLELACDLAGAPLSETAIENAEEEASSLALQTTVTVTEMMSSTNVAPSPVGPGTTSAAASSAVGSSAAAAGSSTGTAVPPTTTQTVVATSSSVTATGAGGTSQQSATSTGASSDTSVSSTTTATTTVAAESTTGSFATSASSTGPPGNEPTDSSPFGGPSAAGRVRTERSMLALSMVVVVGFAWFL